MNQKPPLFQILGISILVLFLHVSGQYLFLYWRFPPLDTIVHALSGACVVVVTLSMFTRRSGFWRHVAISLSLALIAVIIIGVTWEWFELLTENTSFADSNYWADTTTDLIADTVGGILAWWYMINRYKTPYSWNETQH